MRIDVRIVRSGINTFHLDKKLLILRKPSTYDPERPKTYEYMQVKCDGNRVVALRRGSDVHVFTTQGIDVSNKVSHTPWYESLWEKLPQDEWVDGELFVSGYGREHLKTAMASAGPVEFGGFGTSMLSWNAGSGAIHKCMHDMGLSTLPTFSWMEPKEALVEVRKHGRHFDGVVMKNGQYGGWAKHKFQNTMDLVVTGTIPGNGKYAGLVGSLEGSVCLTDRQLMVVANVSGMTYEERASMSKHDVGRVMEVEYERIGSGNRLQHPRFVAWRDDKAPLDCGVDQDPELVRNLYGKASSE